MFHRRVNRAAIVTAGIDGGPFSWAKDGSRTIYAISRPKRLVRAIAVPPVAAPDATARPFR